MEGSESSCIDADFNYAQGISFTLIVNPKELGTFKQEEIPWDIPFPLFCYVL